MDYKKIALCFKYLKHWEEALHYYLECEKHNPEDMHIQANIGQCLIHLGKIDDALKYYFKIEVLAPENQKIRRPLAWCSFLLGKFDIAEQYLIRLLENDPNNKYDLMNLGHVYWCTNDYKKALKYYLDSFLKWKTFKDFELSFNEDRKHLIKHGVNESDIDLMLDYIRIESTEI